MAHHKSAVKRIKTSEQRRERNKHFRTMYRTAVRKLVKTVEDGDLAAARALLPAVVSRLDKSVQKGVLHKRTAARKISRLALLLNKTETGQAG